MSNKDQQGGMDVKQKNVFSAPLHQHANPKSLSSNLPSSNYKVGFCNASIPIAATLTDAFLDFSASKGTDLRKAGLKSGASICIQTSQWKAAGERTPVKLECTHEGALKDVGLDELKKYAAEPDHGGAVWPGDTNHKRGGVARESQEIGGKEPKA